MPKRYWYVIIVYVIMQFSGIIGARLMYAYTSLSLIDSSIYWTIFSFIAALFIILYMMLPDMKMEMRSGGSSTSGVIGWAVIGIFMAYVAQIAASLIETNVFGIQAGSENTQLIMNIARTIPLFVIIPMLVAPILEEIVFRKIIFGSFYKRMNFFFAALLSSLIFAVIHGEPEHLLVYSSMGFVFSYIYVKTKRLIAPILVHAGMNSMTVLALYSLSPEEIEQQIEQLQMIFIGG